MNFSAHISIYKGFAYNVTITDSNNTQVTVIDQIWTGRLSFQVFGRLLKNHAKLSFLSDELVSTCSFSDYTRLGVFCSPRKTFHNFDRSGCSPSSIGVSVVDRPRLFPIS